jgi:hypothetical protein
MWAGRPHAVSGWLMLIYTCHAMPMLCCVMVLRSCFQNGLVVAWHRRSIACVNQSWPHCVSQIGKTQSKPLVAQHGRGSAWERHGMYELAFKRPLSVYVSKVNHIPYLTLVRFKVPAGLCFLKVKL